jgi:hypothetical protein
MLRRRTVRPLNIVSCVPFSSVGAVVSCSTVSGGAQSSRKLSRTQSAYPVAVPNTTSSSVSCIGMVIPVYIRLWSPAAPAARL